MLNGTCNLTFCFFVSVALRVVTASLRTFVSVRMNSTVLRAKVNVRVSMAFVMEVIKYILHDLFVYMRMINNLTPPP